MSSKSPAASDEEVSDIASSELEYEVFLSFRGPDTRTSFTDHLYISLIDAGIRVFRDDEEIRKGEEIGPELLKGIKQSKVALPIFSKGYASSKWCLKELAQIVECKRTTGLKVMPIFYDVTPSEVRNQTGNFEESFKSHEKLYDESIIKDWKNALREVGKVKGWDIQSGTSRRQEGELVKEITNVMIRELKKAYLLVTKYIVGFEHHVEEVLNTLTTEISGVKIVGIYGMGGIGKTTLGKIIYNHLLPGFESHCYLANIRETVRFKGMEFLQNKLISDILSKEWANGISNVDEGIGIIRERFPNKKVLILLDDVDDICQLKNLMRERDCFGSGSKVIISTRNKSIIDLFKVDRSYELSCLDDQQALQLFSQHAFRNDKPLKENAVLSQRIVNIAAGLPLALEVFGSLLCGKNKEEWASIIKKLEKVPHKEVSAKLRISFEALDDQQKQIFLDIACFFNGESKRNVIHFWDEFEFSEEALEVLQQMSLIKLEKDHSMWMHDHLRDLGREIVRQEHMEIEKRSRLWKEEARKLVTKKMGSDNVRGIFLNFQQETEYSISDEEFAMLPNLRFISVMGSHYKRHGWFNKLYGWFNLSKILWGSPLILSKLRWLSWDKFPHEFDISSFSFEDLVILELSFSKIRSNWSGWYHIKMAINLKVLNLTGCENLVRTPNFSSHLYLEQLILTRCSGLVEIDESISLLKHLIIINLNGCRSLCKLPEKLSCTDSLEVLNIDGTSIEEIPSWPPMKKLRVFSASSYGDLFGILKGEIDWDVYRPRMQFTGGLMRLRALPKSFGDFTSLVELNLYLSGIVELPDTIGNLKSLNVLNITYTSIKKLPTTIGMLENLVTLHAGGCSYLNDVPKLPTSLTTLTLWSKTRTPDLSNLINLKHLDLLTSLDDENSAFVADDHVPWWIGKLTNLESLAFGNGRIINLPDLDALSRLTKLSLYCCYELKSIPKLPLGLKSLSTVSCRALTLFEVCCYKSLQVLKIKDCGFSGINGLEMLNDLTTMEIGWCVNLQKLPDLSNLKKLKVVSIQHCPNLVEFPGRLESLDEFHIWRCASLEKIPEIPNSKAVVNFDYKRKRERFENSPQK